MSDAPPGHDWIEADGLHIDVRGLAPPLPMVAILARISQPRQTGPVIIHHDREPIYLYPELAERGWSYELIPADPPEIRLLLTHTP